MDSFDLGKYEKIKPIGSGQFGDVYKIRDKETGEFFAAKISKRPFEDLKNDFRNLESEISIIAKINHPAILKFIGFSLANFEKNNFPTIVTGYCQNGTLNDILVQSAKGLAPEEWNDTMKLINIYGIAVAMAFLHSNSILHRDLKPDNILLDEYLFPVIADFGISKDQNMEKSVAEFKGTPLYVSPEIWKEYNYCKEADVYAFSMILYEICTNEKPFKGITNSYQLSKKVCNGDRPDISSIPQPYRDLIEMCWQQEPSERLSFQEIVEELEGNPDFITETVDVNRFSEYVDYIKGNPKKFNKNMKIILGTIPEPCKILIEEAEKDPKKQYEVGRNFIKGLNSFPKNVERGVEYLRQSIEGGNIDSFILYNKMLIKGDKIEENIEEAKENLQKYSDTDNPDILFLQEMIEEKEKNYEKANEILQKLIKKGYSKAMFQYGKRLYLGEGIEEDEEEAKKFFNLSKKGGYTKSDKFLKSSEKVETNSKLFDIVFLIDGSKSNKFFYESIQNIFYSIAQECKVNGIKSRFGVIIYRNFIFSLKKKEENKKVPFVCNLTSKITEISNFFKEHQLTEGSIKLANDWCSGYQALLTEIKWNKNAEKIVIHLTHVPSYGTNFTMKSDVHHEHFKVPRFDKNKSFKQNLRMYKELQEDCDKTMKEIIPKLAKNGLQFYCLNGNEVCLYCFNKVSSLFIENGGKKFVIKDLFDYTSIDEDEVVDIDSLNNDINEFVLSSLSSDKNNFESECKNQFDGDLEEFFDGDDFNEEDKKSFDISRFEDDGESDDDD